MKCPRLSDLPPPPSGRVGWPWTEETPPCPELMPDGKPWPRISIVTPSFNQGPFIEETIRSVLLQGYPNLEYIIIDGGSTDRSVEVIQKYTSWLDYWVSEKDRGQSDALNKGFARATGNVFAWLNSDDVYLPNACASVGRCFASDDAPWVVGAGLFGPSLEHPGCRIEFWKPDRSELLNGFTYVQPSSFFARELWNTAGGVDVGLQYVMDYDLWCRFSAQGHTPQYVSNELSFFREHSAQKTDPKNKDPWHRELHRIMRHHTGFGLWYGKKIYRVALTIFPPLGRLVKWVRHEWRRPRNRWGR